MSKRARAEKLVGKVIAIEDWLLMAVERVEAGKLTDLQDQEAANHVYGSEEGLYLYGLTDYEGRQKGVTLRRYHKVTGLAKYAVKDTVIKEVTRAEIDVIEKAKSDRKIAEVEATSKMDWELDVHDVEEALGGMDLGRKYRKYGDKLMIMSLDGLYTNFVDAAAYMAQLRKDIETRNNSWDKPIRDVVQALEAKGL